MNNQNLKAISKKMLDQQGNFSMFFHAVQLLVEMPPAG